MLIEWYPFVQTVLSMSKQVTLHLISDLLFLACLRDLFQVHFCSPYTSPQSLLSSPNRVLISIFISISQFSAFADIQILESVLFILLQWFSHNCLALNPDKSEASLLGTHQRNSSLSNLPHINVAGSNVPLSDTIKLLGVTLDKSLTFHKHSNQVSQSCYYHLKALRHIRPCLDNHTASLIAHAFFSSSLD